MGADLRARLLATGRSDFFTEVVGESSLAEQSLEASSVSDLECLWVAIMRWCSSWRAGNLSAGRIWRVENDPAVRVCVE